MVSSLACIAFSYQWPSDMIGTIYQIISAHLKEEISISEIYCEKFKFVSLKIYFNLHHSSVVKLVEVIIFFLTYTNDLPPCRKSTYTLFIVEFLAYLRARKLLINVSLISQLQQSSSTCSVCITELKQVLLL